MTVAGSVTVDVQGRDVSLSSLLTRLEGEMQRADQVGITLANTLGGGLASGAARSAAPVGQLVAELRAATAAAGGDEATFLALAGELSRVALAAGDAARAEQILAQAMGTGGRAATSEAADVRRLTAEEQRAAAGAVQMTQATRNAQGGLSRLSSSGIGLRSALGSLGLAFGAQQLIHFGQESAQTSLALDHTQRVTKEIAGSTEVYNRIVAAARDQQRLFGGSLQENIEGLSGLAVTAKTTGASLTQLIDLQKRLTVLNPAQGAQGGLIALNEALAGNIASLSRRFNIPRVELQKLNDTALPVAERLKVLDQFLNKVGITSAAVSRSTSETAQTYNQLGASLGDATTAFGGFASNALEPAARGLDRLTRLALGTRDALVELRQVATGEDQAAARFAVVANQIDALISRMAAARGELAGGEAFSDPLTGMITQTKEAATASQGLIDTLTPLRGQMIAVASASDTASASVANAAQQLANGAITGPQFAAILDAIAQRSAQSADMEDRRAMAMTSAAGAQAQAQAAATAAEEANTAAMVEQTQKTMESSVQTEQLAKFQALLASLGGQVAGGFITDANAAIILKGQYRNLGDEAIRLINLQAQLANARARAGAEADFRAGERSGGQFRSAGDQRAFADNARAQAKAQDEAAAAAVRYQSALGKFGPAIARANQELANLPKGTAAYYDKLSEIQGLKERQLSAGRKAAGSAHLSDQAKLNNSLLDSQQRADDQAEALERKHDQKLLDIDKEFAKKSLEQQKANELSKRQSEIDFLKQLTSSELNNSKEGKAELARIDAKYYADFQKAQEAAQAGNLKQSEELAAQARHRADVELQYAEQIEKARKDKNAGEVARLTALREKERQLLDEQDKQIQEGGDPIVKARQEALDEEGKNFAEQQGKIGDAADAAAQRKIDAALRSGKAIDAENLRLQEQEQIINRIGARQPGGAAAGGGTGAPAPSGAATPTATDGGPLDLSTVVSAINSLQPLLDAVKAAVEADTLRTTAAIRTLGGTSGERLLR